MEKLYNSCAVAVVAKAPTQRHLANRNTRKLSYRKDDRAMRPICECAENFRESLTTPTGTFPEIFNGLFF